MRHGLTSMTANQHSSKDGKGPGTWLLPDLWWHWASVFNKLSWELVGMCNLEKEQRALNCFEHSLMGSPSQSQLAHPFLEWRVLKQQQQRFLKKDLMSAFKLLELGIDLDKLAKSWHDLHNKLDTGEDIARVNACHSSPSFLQLQEWAGRACRGLQLHSWADQD